MYNLHTGYDPATPSGSTIFRGHHNGFRIKSIIPHKNGVIDGVSKFFRNEKMTKTGLYVLGLSEGEWVSIEHKDLTPSF